MSSGLGVVSVGTAGIDRLLDRADWGRSYRAADVVDWAHVRWELTALDLRELDRCACGAAVASYASDRTFTELVGLYRRLLTEANARGTDDEHAAERHV